MSEHVRYLATPSGFLMVLRQGDDVLARIEKLMRVEDIPSASLTGFGFAERARLGFFDFDRGDYDPRDFENLEITGLVGTCAWMDGKPAIHAHATGGDSNFNVVGGHVLGLIVGRGSFEITVLAHPHHLQRAVEPGIGAKVLQLTQDNTDGESEGLASRTVR
jgi:predicted DNA-binding protein with PD1-like motif